MSDGARLAGALTVSRMSPRIPAFAVAAVAALGAAGVAQAKGHHHHHHHVARPYYAKPGAYTGTAGASTIAFTVARDAKSIKSGLTLTQVPVDCQQGPDTPLTQINFDHGFPITGNHLTYTHAHDGSLAQIQVTFAKGGAATGTYTFHFAPPPPPPPGTIPPGATWIDPGACDTGTVSFTAVPAASRR